MLDRRCSPAKSRRSETRTPSRPSKGREEPREHHAFWLVEEVAVMLNFAVALAVLLVWAFARVRLAAFAEKTMRSLELDYPRRLQSRVIDPMRTKC